MSALYSPELIALICQFPVAALAWRRNPNRDNVFWFMLAAAFVGPLFCTISAHYPIWRTDLPSALWTSIVVTWGVFFILSAMTNDAWRLVAILAPILTGMAILATIWSGNFSNAYSPETANTKISPSLSLHIAVSITTYAFVTIAAAASCAGIIQDRALKAKHPTPRSRGLPALSRCDAMMFQFLSLAEVVLALGLLSGILLNYQHAGEIIQFDHKTILTLITFGLIGTILVVHRLLGIRGLIAARWALSAYLSLTLGYPGVKLVTDILLV